MASNPGFKNNTLFNNDMMNVFIGIIAQTVLVAGPLYLILHNYGALAICIGLFFVCAIWLKIKWWNRLDEQL